MPPKPLRVRTRKQSELTPDQVEHLLKGFCTLDGVVPDYGHTNFPFRDDAHRRECWKKHKKFIMSLEGDKPRHDVNLTGSTFPKETLPAAWEDYE